MKNTTGALLAALAFTAFSTAAEVYKWIDKEGNVQYSDRPPPDSATKSTPRKLAVPAPTDAGGSTVDTAWRDKDLEFKKRRVEESEKEKKREQLKPICNDTRGKLKWFLENDRVKISQFNEKGDPVWMTRQERNAEIARVREFISLNCE